MIIKEPIRILAKLTIMKKKITSAHCCAPICPALGYISLRPGRSKVLTRKLLGLCRCSLIRLGTEGSSLVVAGLISMQMEDKRAYTHSH